MLCHIHYDVEWWTVDGFESSSLTSEMVFRTVQSEGILKTPCHVHEIADGNAG